jgi:hypothetical protein
MDSRSDPLGCLEPPSCPSCRVKMRWFRSELVRQGHWAFAHLFLCPKCESAEIIETGFAADLCTARRSQSVVFLHDGTK